MRSLLVIWRWLTSRSCRTALDEYRRTRTQLRRQADQTAPEVRHAILLGLAELRQAILRADSPELLRARHQALHDLAYTHLDDPRGNRLKDGSEMVLTAVVAVLAVRTFFAQPMEVPTSSMQPTLYGVTIENLLDQPGSALPGFWKQLQDKVLEGRSYYHIRATAPGRFQGAEPPQPTSRWLGWLPTLRQQRFQIGPAWYTVQLPRLELPNPAGIPPEYLFVFHAGVDPQRDYSVGDDIVKLAVTTGDHLLIDRFSLHFRRPQRGEIVVFSTGQITNVQEDAHYLKRLVAVGGDTVQIGDDRHLRINGIRLDAATPYFSDLYDFRGPPADGQYSGHIHDGHARRLRLRPGFLAPRFPDGRTVHRVAPGHLLVLGDNTVSSYDSRKFGDIPQSAIVGRLLAVYWPVSQRVGFNVQ